MFCVLSLVPSPDFYTKAAKATVQSSVVSSFGFNPFQHMLQSLLSLGTLRFYDHFC